jgi:PPOX class probable F420-dependent enzyme
MAITFDEPTRGLLDGKNFAIVATVNPDGSPHTSVVWFKRDGDTLLLSTTETRIKARNLARDPRVSLSIFDTTNPYSSVDIRGTAELTVDENKALPKTLSQRYLGQDPPPEPDELTRLIVRVLPEKLTHFSA